jgi:benzoyl-CoA-dihydrodiol lyase
VAETAQAPLTVDFETHPSKYRHWKLDVQGERARLVMNVQEDLGMREGYVLKQNSYDLGVDIELADAIQRLRFEHPQVRVVVVTGALDRVFCAGANIFMLRSSTHAWKVNFCKFTNETRLAIEDASATAGVKFLAALNGTAAGGGYELALACDKILLVDDRNSAVSFPEVPLLGVLPGTGGLTRVVDKRKVRRDLADVFSTLAEGVKGKRAVEWNLVDAVAPLSQFPAAVEKMAGEMLAATPDKAGRQGLALEALAPAVGDGSLAYRHVRVEMDKEARTAELTLTVPDQAPPKSGDAARALGTSWWIFRAFREIDDAVLRLRVNHPDVGVILVKTRGRVADVLATDAALESLKGDWFVSEVRHFVKRTLKRLDVTSKSFYALVDDGSCFAGTVLEIALAGDRIFVLNDPDHPIEMAASSLNAGPYPMANGLTRLATRFLGNPEKAAAVVAQQEPFGAESASELGLATAAPDEIDWEDEVRVAIEERASFSPDALTGMESNLRFAGAETMETKIFGRLSAWQNWIFQRPNAVGERGALNCYGTPMRAEFNYQRT